MNITPVISRDQMMAVAGGAEYAFAPGRVGHCCLSCAWRIVSGSRLCGCAGGGCPACAPAGRLDRGNGYWVKAPERK